MNIQIKTVKISQSFQVYFSGNSKFNKNFDWLKIDVLIVIFLKS
jgi:hypothetical protein